jgi:hypothetical protein
MTVDHPHVRAIAVEPNELAGAFTETRVIVTGYADVRFESRKTANPAGEAVWNRRHFKSPDAPYAMEARHDLDLAFCREAYGGVPWLNKDLDEERET